MVFFIGFIPIFWCQACRRLVVVEEARVETESTSRWRLNAGLAWRKVVGGVMVVQWSVMVPSNRVHLNLVSSEGCVCHTLPLSVGSTFPEII
jgi:hypothetical protein